MRFSVFAGLCALVLSGCVVEVSKGYDYRPGPGRWRSHRSVYVGYSNAAGEAYGEAASIRSLAVLPITLPVELEGGTSPQNNDNWRTFWPLRGANVLAATISSARENGVQAFSVTARPDSGYYLELEITRFGLEEPSHDGTFSSVSASGRIYNAASGQMVVELHFEEAAQRTQETPPFDELISNIGNNVNSWLADKQASSRR